MVDELHQRSAAMLDDVGHVLPREGIEDEDAGDEHHRQTERAARGLEQEQDASGAGDEIERRGLAGPSGKLAIKRNR